MRGGSAARFNSPPGAKNSTAASARCTATETVSIRSQPRGRLHAIAKDVADIGHRSLETPALIASAAIRVTMPMFWTPAAFSMSMMSIRS